MTVTGKRKHFTGTKGVYFIQNSKLINLEKICDLDNEFMERFIIVLILEGSQ